VTAEESVAQLYSKSPSSGISPIGCGTGPRRRIGAVEISVGVGKRNGQGDCPEVGKSASDRSEPTNKVFSQESSAALRIPVYGTNWPS
jgi:hypothetical protein